MPKLTKEDWMMLRATRAAESIYKKLDSLPKGVWIHGTDFLPANVTTDYQGKRGFINSMTIIILNHLKMPKEVIVEELKEKV
jgi:hypothetical protein